MLSKALLKVSWWLHNYIDRFTWSAFLIFSRHKIFRDSSKELSAILEPRVLIPSTTSKLFSIHKVQIIYLSFDLECEKNKNKQKEAGIGRFKNCFESDVTSCWNSFQWRSCSVTQHLSLKFNAGSNWILNMNKNEEALIQCDQMME